MTELNEKLLKELASYRETDTPSDELKKLFMEMIWQESKKPRYKFVTDNVKIYCEAKAYEDCCRHAVHFNPQKSDKPNLYIGCIIWNSYCGTIKKHSTELGLKTTRKVYEA